jgi:hypothetical protein
MHSILAIMAKRQFELQKRSAPFFCMAVSAFTCSHGAVVLYCVESYRPTMEDCDDTAEVQAWWGDPASRDRSALATPELPLLATVQGSD